MTGVQDIYRWEDEPFRADGKRAFDLAREVYGVRLMRSESPPSYGLAIAVTKVGQHRSLSDALHVALRLTNTSREAIVIPVNDLAIDETLFLPLAGRDSPQEIILLPNREVISRGEKGGQGKKVLAGP